MSSNELFANNILDASIILIYLFLVFFSSRKYGVMSWKIQYLAVGIGLLHLIMSVVFTYYSLGTPSDSKGYFRNSVQHNVWESFGFGDGTVFISQLIYPFTKGLGVSYLGSNLLFSMLSLWGVYRLYDVSLGILKKWTPWFMIFLIPSMHFWTGFLGKDALVFFGIASLVYNAFFRKKLIHYILPVFFIMFARFYILVFLAAGFLFALVILSNKIKIYQKVIIAIGGLVAMVYLSPFFFSVVGIKETDKLSERREVILQANMEGGSGIDLSNSNLAVRFFSYLFRPFVFEAHSFTSLMAAIENILWLILFFIVIRNFRKIMKNQDTLFWFCISAFFTVLLPAAYLLSNLGIAARQKIMVVPFLFYIFFMVLRRRNFPST